MNSWEINRYVFIHPFNLIISGPTQSGKSFLLNKILINHIELINPSITTIHYCYSTWNKEFDGLLHTVANLKFHKGIIDVDLIDTKETNLIILDDLMTECVNDPEIMKLFTIGTHHRNMSVVFLTQNLYVQGKHSRTISLNSHYLIIFKNNRDKTQIKTLARQMFPDKYHFLPEAFTDATQSNHGYIFIDMKASTDDKNRIQTDIIPDIKRIIYVAK